jgi:hypothetical protein
MAAAAASASVASHSRPARLMADIARRRWTRGQPSRRILGERCLRDGRRRRCGGPVETLGGRVVLHGRQSPALPAG